jgi:hypothetical protein
VIVWDENLSSLLMKKVLQVFLLNPMYQLSEKIKKSATETATKISSGQAGGNAKGNLAKTPANPLAPQT